MRLMSTGHVGLGRRSERLSRPQATSEFRTEIGSIVVTPERPSYRYANLLVLDAPPEPSQLGSIIAAYRDLAQESLLPGNVTIAWEEALSRLGMYTTDALEGEWLLLQDDVLCFDQQTPRHERDDIFLDELDSSEWRLVSRMAVPADGFVEDGTRDWLLTERRRLIEQGLGAWWVARNQRGEVLATCGAFTRGSIVRLDQLLVAPTARRQGIGSWLVHAIARVYGNRSIVMEPQAGTWRSMMYQDAGFVSIGRTTVLVELLDQVPE